MSVGFRGTSRRRKALPEGEFEAVIVDLAEDGRGVARLEGKVCFVHGALPGETVKFRYTRVHRDADEGETTQVMRASPDRVQPPCAHFGVCGGCALQHLAPPAQIGLKQHQTLEALRRIGKVGPESIAAPITGPTTGYRRRARLGAKYVDKRGTALVGFRERASPFLAALDSCVVLDPRVGLALRALGECISDLSIRRDLPQIEIASAGDGPADGPVALVLRVLKPPSDSDRDRLVRLAIDHGFTLYLQSGGPDSVTPLIAPAAELLYDPDGGPDRLRFLPTDFIQVNAAVSRQAVRQAIDWLNPSPGGRVLELFCGLGNFSIPLSRRDAHVTAVEGDAGLVERARANARVAGLEVVFHTADLFQPRPEAAWQQGPYEAVLLDPPRAGAEAMMPIIGALQPDRVVYVSCHPGTLARDAGMLVNEHGYRLTRAGVMDMFPHTTHVESMALFERRK
jgi:23S rRNA (uracil1939-C5)-methyltransferase